MARHLPLPDPSPPRRLLSDIPWQETHPIHLYRENTVWPTLPLPVYRPQYVNMPRHPTFHGAFGRFTRAMADFFVEGYGRCLTYHPHTVDDHNPGQALAVAHEIQFILHEDNYLFEVQKVLATLNTREFMSDDSIPDWVVLCIRNIASGIRHFTFGVQNSQDLSAMPLVDADSARLALFMRVLVHVETLMTRTLPIIGLVNPNALHVSFTYHPERHAMPPAVWSLWFQAVRLPERRRAAAVLRTTPSTGGSMGRLPVDIWATILGLCAPHFVADFLRRRLGLRANLYPIGATVRWLGPATQTLRVTVNGPDHRPFTVDDDHLARFNDLPLTASDAEMRDLGNNEFEVVVNVVPNEGLQLPRGFGRSWRVNRLVPLPRVGFSYFRFISWSHLRCSLGLQSCRNVIID